MTPLSDIEQKAIAKLAEAQNQALIDCAAKIQAIENFLHQQPANASSFRRAENASTLEETESNLRAAVQGLEKAMSGRP